MRIDVCRILKRVGPPLLLSACILAASAAQAQSGSAQTVMTLVVPATGSNTADGPGGTVPGGAALNRSRPSSPAPVYVADTSVGVLQRLGNAIYRIWMSI